MRNRLPETSPSATDRAIHRTDRAQDELTQITLLLRQIEQIETRHGHADRAWELAELRRRVSRIAADLDTATENFRARQRDLEDLDAPVLL
jgi:hypothetical protein